MKVNDISTNRVEELASVADDQQRLGPLQEVLFQPEHCDTGMTGASEFQVLI